MNINIKNIIILSMILFLGLFSCKEKKTSTTTNLAANENNAHSSIKKSLSNCTSYKDWDSTAKGLDVNSNRSRQEIVDVVQKGISQLKTLKTKHPNEKGMILVSIGINNCGEVDTCFIIDTEVKNKKFEQEVLGIIKNWKFEKVDREDDYLLIKYPFNFL